jgi:hypothetical protein
MTGFDVIGGSFASSGLYSLALLKNIEGCIGSPRGDKLNWHHIMAQILKSFIRFER